MTAAYKRKLEEDQKWLAEEKIREARDAKQDVTKAGHMGNFYRCLPLWLYLGPAQRTALMATCQQSSGVHAEGAHMRWGMPYVHAACLNFLQGFCSRPLQLQHMCHRNIMSNNTAFGTAQPPKRPAGPAPSSTDSIKEGSSAPVDPEWEAARYSCALSVPSLC